MNFLYDFLIIDKNQDMANFMVDELNSNGLKATTIEKNNAPLFLANNPTKVVIFDESPHEDTFEYFYKIYDNARQSIIVLAIEDNIEEYRLIELKKLKVNLVYKPYSLNEFIYIIKQGGFNEMNNFEDKKKQQYGQQMDMGGMPQNQGVYPPQQNMGQFGGPMDMPQNQGGYPPQMNPYGTPYDMGQPNQGGYPPQQNMGQFGGPMDIPQNQGGYPPQMNPYGTPYDVGQPNQGGYPPQMNPYGTPYDMGQPNQGGYPPQMNPYGTPYDMGQPNQGGYPPQPNMGQFGGPMDMPQNQGGYMPQQHFNPQTIIPKGATSFKQTVIAVNCPKGGVGKTTISKELAIAFATTRVNGNPLKVCLVDGNIGFGDVATMLKVKARPNIKVWTSDIKEKRDANPDVQPRYSQQTIEQEFLIKHTSGLFVLAAPSNHVDSLDIDADQMTMVIDNLKSCDFDVIIIDTANNTQDYTLVALEKADQVLMITTMEITSISDTRTLLNTLREIQFPIERIRLVVNKMPPQKQDKDIQLDEIEKVLQTNIIAIIPDYPNIRKLNNNGDPAMLGKDNELTIAIRELANKVVPIFSSINMEKGQKNNSSPQKKGLFSSLFQKK